MSSEEFLAKVFDAASERGTTGAFADVVLIVFGYLLVGKSADFTAQLKQDVAFWIGVTMAGSGGIDLIRRLPFLPSRRRR